MLVAGNGDGLEVLPAEHCADAGAALGTVTAENACVLAELLACGADADDAALYTAAVVSVEKVTDLLLGVRRALAPYILVVGIAESEGVVINFEPGMLGAFTGENEGVVARSLEVVAEGTAAVCGGDGAGLCGNCGNVKAAGAGSTRAGERSGRDNDNILLGQCLLLAGQVVVENFGGHRLAAEVQFLFLVAPRIVFELTGRKVEFRNFIHVSGVLAHYINPFKFALWAYPP